ncbi:hypothetical protein [Pseudobacteriovorax antillogorgiicola]|uniref:Uncharacterized protein n=1 Tax=Pseudobacteriovorax antillogorgiicola TaxID=1513793 RepID=A0A1Y6C9W0_9BACT|nr:hypothetical protein [Pseudobacteriovorax antillogorgiicola]TCS48972.1 hypothetical protein EDD56_11614 [Pseudobacteriovorax antillogorgiicola]SMF53557.1 hypothetical protein SAMN06296036_116140 [Pseudobacteriovorax antillogorgiicola]
MKTLLFVVCISFGVACNQSGFLGKNESKQANTDQSPEAVSEIQPDPVVAASPEEIPSEVSPVDEATIDGSCTDAAQTVVTDDRLARQYLFSKSEQIDLSGNEQTIDVTMGYDAEGSYLCVYSLGNQATIDVASLVSLKGIYLKDKGLNNNFLLTLAPGVAVDELFVYSEGNTKIQIVRE